MKTKIEKIVTPLGTHYEAQVQEKFLWFFKSWVYVNYFFGINELHTSEYTSVKYYSIREAEIALEKYDQWINGTHLKQIVKYN